MLPGIFLWDGRRPTFEFRLPLPLPYENNKSKTKLASSCFYHSTMTCAQQWHVVFFSFSLLIKLGRMKVG